MLLAVDVGNSSLKLGLFAGEELVGTWRMATDVRRSSDEYGVLFTGVLRRRGPLPKLEAVVIASVVRRLNPILEEICERYLKAPPVFLGLGMDVGLTVQTDNLRQVGVDRLADAVAGVALYGAPIITVDMGTHTVFNAVSAAREFLGGAIAPGLNATLEGLVRSSASLPPIDLAFPPQAIGRDTVAAMQSGLVLGYVGLVEGLLQRFWAEMGHCTVVGTGGYGRLIAAHTSLIDFVDPDLTLKGLRLAYARNANRR
ncbi:MAG: type III pantothenate kinase [Chloroflexota bacterium]